jgi:hypothetical protein
MLSTEGSASLEVTITHNLRDAGEVGAQIEF